MKEWSCSAAVTQSLPAAVLVKCLTGIMTFIVLVFFQTVL